MKRGGKGKRGKKGISGPITTSLPSSGYTRALPNLTIDALATLDVEQLKVGEASVFTTPSSLSSSVVLAFSP